MRQNIYETAISGSVWLTDGESTTGGDFESFIVHNVAVIASSTPKTGTNLGTNTGGPETLVAIQPGKVPYAFTAIAVTTGDIQCIKRTSG